MLEPKYGWRVYFDGTKFAVDENLTKIRKSQDKAEWWYTFCEREKVVNLINAINESAVIEKEKLEDGVLYQFGDASDDMMNNNNAGFIMPGMMIKQCPDCISYFLIYAKWYKEKGLALPKRCHDCREKRKQQAKKQKEVVEEKKKLPYIVFFTQSGAMVVGTWEVSGKEASENGEYEIPQFATLEEASEYVINEHKTMVPEEELEEPDVFANANYRIRKCKKCGKLFQIMHVDWYKEKGFELPKRCPSCRKSKREEKK